MVLANSFDLAERTFMRETVQIPLLTSRKAAVKAIKIDPCEQVLRHLDSVTFLASLISFYDDENENRSEMLKLKHKNKIWKL